MTRTPQRTHRIRLGDLVVAAFDRAGRTVGDQRRAARLAAKIVVKSLVLSDRIDVVQRLACA